MNSIVLKNIFSYLFRVFIFLLLNRTYMWKITLFLSYYIALSGSLWFLTLIFVSILQVYLTAKLCGLFKKLDNLNLFTALIIVVLIELAYNYLSLMTKIQLNPFKVSFQSQNIILLVIPCFVLYKILNILGKKFPVTFGKIGYFTSIEFWKKLFIKTEK